MCLGGKYSTAISRQIKVPFPLLYPFTVMSGNSADSYSEGESEGEQAKEKPESPTIAPSPKSTPTLLYVRKGKNNGRVGRPKKIKNAQSLAPPPPPLVPISRRRGSGKTTFCCVFHDIGGFSKCIWCSNSSQSN